MLTPFLLQIRLYSRDLELNSQKILHREVVTSHVVILSLVDNSLLVYTADNTLFHYLIVPTADSIKLHLCGSITFNGIIAAPSAVRLLSWMIPSAQKRTCVSMVAFTRLYQIFIPFLELGDPVDDLGVATVLMMVGGQLVLLRPRKVKMKNSTSTWVPKLMASYDPSREIKKSSMTCKFLQTVLSSVGYTFAVSARWRTRCGAMMVRVSGSGWTP